MAPVIMSQIQDWILHETDRVVTSNLKGHTRVPINLRKALARAFNTELENVMNWIPGPKNEFCDPRMLADAYTFKTMLEQRHCEGLLADCTFVALMENPATTVNEFFTVPLVLNNLEEDGKKMMSDKLYKVVLENLDSRLFDFVVEQVGHWCHTSATSAVTHFRCAQVEAANELSTVVPWVNLKKGRYEESRPVVTLADNVNPFEDHPAGSLMPSQPTHENDATFDVPDVSVYQSMVRIEMQLHLGVLKADSGTGVVTNLNVDFTPDNR
ncbi:protein ORF133 [Anguillid herpesvirus 1]|nr:protein ORF133 [Anguillid herpesvirus 1]